MLPDQLGRPRGRSKAAARDALSQDHLVHYHLRQQTPSQPRTSVSEGLCTNACTDAPRVSARRFVLSARNGKVSVAQGHCPRSSAPTPTQLHAGPSGARLESGFDLRKPSVSLESGSVVHSNVRSRSSLASGLRTTSWTKRLPTKHLGHVIVPERRIGSRIEANSS